MDDKIIIVNKTDYPLSRCFDYIKVIISTGRVSNDGKSYCYVTQFKDGTMVAAQRNKQSDTFTLWTGK